MIITKISVLSLVLVFGFSTLVLASFPTIELLSPTSIAEVQQLIQQGMELKNQYEALKEQLDSTEGRAKFLADMTMGEGTFEEAEGVMGGLQKAEGAVSSIMDGDVFNEENWNTIFATADDLSDSVSSMSDRLENRAESIESLGESRENNILQNNSPVSINYKKDEETDSNIVKRDTSDDITTSLSKERIEELEQQLEENPHQREQLEEKLQDNKRDLNNQTRKEIFWDDYATDYQLWFPRDNMEGWEQRSEDENIGLIDQLQNLEETIDDQAEKFIEDGEIENMTETAYREADYANSILQSKIMLAELNASVDLNRLVYYHILNQEDN